METMLQGKMRYKYLIAHYHKIECTLLFDVWEHNNCGGETIIVVNKLQFLYTYAYDDFIDIITHIDEYVWYKFKK